jgi:intracellular multiplication protein IcmL
MAAIAQKNAPSKKPGAPAARPQNTGGLERVMLRNSFYRDHYRLVVSMLPMLLVALIVSLAVNVMLVNRPVQTRYFTVDTSGRVTKIVALSEAFVTEPFLTSWTTERITRAYSMDPQNFRREVGDLEPDFTAEGFLQFKQSLQDSGTLDMLQKNLMISSAVPQGAPVIVDRGTTAGVYYWKLQIPVLVQYRSSSKSGDQKMLVSVIVVRRQTLENPLGIGISQIVATNM